jgi:hypothetical protein
MRVASLAIIKASCSNRFHILPPTGVGRGTTKESRVSPVSFGAHFLQQVVHGSSDTARLVDRLTKPSRVLPRRISDKDSLGGKFCRPHFFRFAIKGHFSGQRLLIGATKASVVRAIIEGFLVDQLKTCLAFLVRRNAPVKPVRHV